MTGSASSTGASRALSGRVLARVFLRSLLLQASWNRRGMQNLGVVYALWPALERLYPDRERRTAAARRHLAFFNTHPYLAPAILGGALHHEERIAAGAADPQAAERFKAALMGPFAAVGDSFFWLALRPAAGIAAALAAPWIGLWAVALFLALYNLPHLAFRVALFVGGYRSGELVVQQLGRAALPKWGARLRRFVAVGGGVALVMAVHELGTGLGPWVLAVLAVAGASWALLARVEAMWVGIGAVILGICLALAGV